MVRLRFSRFILLQVLLIVAGCEKQAAVPTSRPVVPAGTGIVRGIVRFIGNKPVVKIIGGECCPGSTPVADESLTINTDNTIKDVVVFIKDGPNIDPGPLQDRVLAQKNCQYKPHVLAMQTSQNLVITNHDPTVHNVMVQAEANPSDNFSELAGASHSKHFEKPELVRFKCSVHAWMTGYAYVFDHPFFCVTGDDGRFEIDRLPPGTYTLVAWQEKLEPQEMRVTVSDKPAEVRFEYHGE